VSLCHLKNSIRRLQQPSQPIKQDRAAFASAIQRGQSKVEEHPELVTKLSKALEAFPTSESLTLFSEVAVELVDINQSKHQSRLR
jgi:hypothetical protein